MNEDLSYPHHLHHADHTLVTGVRLQGDMMVTFAGIVGKGDSTELDLIGLSLQINCLAPFSLSTTT